MIRNISFFFLLILVSISAYAQDEKNLNTGKSLSRESGKWLRISEIEQEQGKIFDQYRKDKDDLEQKYEETLADLEQAGGEELMKKKIKLEKEFKRKKERLLEAYRQENWRLQKESNALKGRKTVVTSDTQMKNRLKKY